VETISRRVIKRQIHFLSLLVRRMMAKYLDVTFNQRRRTPPDKGPAFSVEHISALGQLLQDRVVQRLSDRLLPVATEGLALNRKTCTEVFGRAKLVIDNLFQFAVPALNLSQPRPTNNYGRVAKVVDSLLSHSMYSRVVGTLAASTDSKVRLKVVSLVGTHNMTGDVVRDCTVSRLPLWFKIKMLRYR
jgi:hypothetical protein